MKTLLLAGIVLAAAAAINLSPALAQSGSSGAAAGTQHYEWQYHYVGHHPHYQGYWAPVK